MYLLEGGESYCRVCGAPFLDDGREVCGPCERQRGLWGKDHEPPKVPTHEEEVGK